MNIPPIGEANILTIIHEKWTSDFLTALLTGEGYRVKTFSNQDEAMQTLLEEQFRLVICEFRDEGIDGIQVCKAIRRNFALRYIPIILLIRGKDPMDKIKGIYSGADDYIEKPFEPAEFLARVKASLLRTTRDLDANPLTKLPGNVSILKELESRIKSKEKFCVGFSDLNKFKELNDRYGFERGDKVILFTAEVIIKALETLGKGTEFLGHIGGDDFIFITTPGCIDAISNGIIEGFQKNISDFYDEADKTQGYIIAKNRSGEVSQIPIMSISIAVVSNELRSLDHVGQIIQIGAELKNYAKTFRKNIYIKDRRKE
jgi:diguanylate cyclase (GGDEF)-like protein